MKVVDLAKICDEYGINTYSFQKSPELVRAMGLEEGNYYGGGLAFCFKDTAGILFDEDLPTLQLRFTVAHEIAHIMLGHVSFRGEWDRKHAEISEREADTFAVQLLANELRERFMARW